MADSKETSEKDDFMFEMWYVPSEKRWRTINSANPSGNPVLGCVENPKDSKIVRYGDEVLVYDKNNSTWRREDFQDTSTLDTTPEVTIDPSKDYSNLKGVFNMDDSDEYEGFSDLYTKAYEISPMMVVGLLLISIPVTLLFTAASILATIVGAFLWILFAASCSISYPIILLAHFLKAKWKSLVLENL